MVLQIRIILLIFLPIVCFTSEYHDLLANEEALKSGENLNDMNLPAYDCGHNDIKVCIHIYSKFSHSVPIVLTIVWFLKNNVDYKYKFHIIVDWALSAL